MSKQDLLRNELIFLMIPTDLDTFLDTKSICSFQQHFSSTITPRKRAEDTLLIAVPSMKSLASSISYFFLPENNIKFVFYIKRSFVQFEPFRKGEKAYWPLLSGWRSVCWKEQDLCRPQIQWKNGTIYCGEIININ